LGCAVAFIVAVLAIKFFIDYVSRYGFVAFGWYRIIVGGILIGMSLCGYQLEIS
jgi:undecaprenyl-diphosphatase